MRITKISTVVAFALGSCWPAVAGFEWDEGVQEAIRWIPSPATENSTGAPRLINGAPVSPGSWRQTVRIRTGSAGCTASIVGPRALATAAHCANTGDSAVFTLDGVQYKAKMTRHPLYPRPDMDVSLGLIDKAIAGVEYGVLPNRVDVVKAGMPIRLMGYGCVKPGGGGGNDGILREGMSAVTGFQNFDIVTRKTGGSALCFGDSGGPAWIEVEQGGLLVRLNISQNSKGDIERTSYLARWDVKEAQEFVRKWITDNGNVEVCGINKDCVGTGPGPNPEPATFTAEGKTVSLSGTVKDQKLSADMAFVRRIFEQAIFYLDSQ